MISSLRSHQYTNQSFNFWSIFDPLCNQQLSFIFVLMPSVLICDQYCWICCLIFEVHLSRCPECIFVLFLKAYFWLLNHFNPLCYQHWRYHSILMPCVLICGQYCGICWMLRCCRIGRQKCISTTLCVKLWRKTHRFFLRSVALLYRTISDKRMWKISLMFIFFFLSLFKVMKLLLKEDSNMLTKELSFYIQDDD